MNVSRWLYMSAKIRCKYEQANKDRKVVWELNDIVMKGN